MAAGLTMAACNNQTNNGKTVESNDTVIVTTEVPSDEFDSEEGIDELDAIRSIRKEWVDKPIKVEADKETVGIEQFALAFCKTYPDFVVNKMMRDYLVAPENYKNELYGIDNRSDNDFIRCMMMVETTHQTDVCCWDRKDGHKLFAVYMAAGYESGDGEDQVVFYDYDPATGIMTPEPALADMVEKQGKGYDIYEVRLPREGKDIVVYVCTANKELDNYDCDEHKLTWNGMTFEN